MIPTVALSEVSTAPGLAPRLSADAFNATNRAITQAGGALQDVGDMLNRFAMQKQEHVNKGFLAGEEAVRMQTAAQIEKYATENPDKPETWAKFQESTWKSYEQGRSDRAKAQGWGNDVVTTDKQLSDSYRAEFGIRFNAETDKGMIRQANARQQSVATMHLATGNVKGALAAVDSMTLYPEARQAMIEKITNDYLSNKVVREISDIGNLPPAKQIKSLAVVEAELIAVNKKGEPINGWVENEQGDRIGGLNQQERIRLIRATRESINAAEVTMAQNGRVLVRQAQLGVDPAIAFSDARNKGLITDEVAKIFLPELQAELKDKQTKADVAAERLADALATRQDKAEAAAQRQIDARTGATLTMKEIERREAIGIARPNDPSGLSKDAANRLRGELQNREGADVYEPDFLKVNGQLEEKLGQNIIGTFFSDSAQMNPVEKRKMLNDIASAKVSVGAKLKLMDKFFETVKWDLRDKEISEMDGDRDIGPEEKDLRSNMIDFYRKAGTDLGPRSIGAHYMADTQRINDWFSKNENASPAAKQAKANEFYAQTQKEVTEEASTGILSSTIYFQ